MKTTAKHSAFICYPANPGKAFAGLFLFIFSGFPLLLAQSSPPKEYQVKAVFLFNFTQFVEWPSTAFNSAADPFVIGILGEDPFGDYIKETIAGEQFMGHPLVVQHYTTAKDIGNCHILFINSNDPKKIKATLSAVVNRSILTVSDTDNFAYLGGMIGFVTRDNKIRLQIKPAAAKDTGLNISSKLLRVADIID